MSAQRTPLLELAEQAVARMKFGKASAVKRGRNPKFPFVPIVDHGKQDSGLYLTYTEQIRGKAYETREAAVAYAERVIAARKAHVLNDLQKPGSRAFREQWGMPREIAAIARATPTAEGVA